MHVCVCMCMYACVRARVCVLELNICVIETIREYMIT